ncbi:cellulose biosynthesis protein BcsQ [Pluralibacter gergoviae]|uniref:cellulose biosynthesis protein BcsQ n=1 Tax=Pluralibacter gergoviae TaxID=61647 RepID=UPI00155E825D|nr:cellulose biosynthesis protein BcsQ [Pluralibacter gergoviae]
MPVLVLQGVRGGVGTSSLTAALGWALQVLGESAIVVDACPNNMLLFFFNDDIHRDAGWARALIDGTPWQDAGMSYTSRLDFLSFGKLSAAESLNLPALSSAVEPFPALIDALHQRGGYRWVVVDLPSEPVPALLPLVNACDYHLTVVTPDANTHIRLHQQALPEKSHLLVNMLNTGSQLQEDLYQLWTQTQARLLPTIVHRDEAVAECLAAKQPLGEYRFDALAAEEILTLANWCLAQAGGAEKSS